MLVYLPFGYACYESVDYLNSPSLALNFTEAQLRWMAGDRTTELDVYMITWNGWLSAQWDFTELLQPF